MYVQFLVRSTSRLGIKPLAREKLGSNTQVAWNLIKDVHLYKPKITNVWPAIETMQLFDYLLPEEFIEFRLLRDKPGDLLTQLHLLCYTIPTETAECMSLILASYNMHLFGIWGMDSSDVFVDTN